MREAIWRRHNINRGLDERIPCTILRYTAGGDRVKIQAHFLNRDAIRYVKKNHLEIKHVLPRR